MPDTIVHTAESAVDGTVTGLATAVGSLTNEAAHHAETLAAHADRLTNIESDMQWTKERISDLLQTATAAPPEALADIRTQLTDLQNALAEQAESLSETVAPEVVDPPTEPPPPQTNEAPEAKHRGPFGSLRAALHRLL